MTARKERKGRKLRWFRTAPGITIAAILAVTAGYAGAATFTLLTQTVPGGTVPVTGFGPACATVAMDTTASGASANAAEVVYNCTTSAGIDVTTAGSHTPTFALPPAFSDLLLVPSNAKGIPSTSTASPACSGYTGTVTLTSGTPSALSVGNYDYCFDSSNPGGAITSFTVSWS